MEGAAVAQTCRQFRVSCLVVRSIPYRADAMALQSYRRYGVTASENAAALVAAIIEGLNGYTRNTLQLVPCYVLQKNR